LARCKMASGNGMTAHPSQRRGLIFLKAYSTAEGAYPPPGYTPAETERDETDAPKGDLLIKNYNVYFVNYAGQHILTHQTWVVSRKNPSQHHRLPVYRDQSGEDLNSRCTEMSHYISADQKWILRRQVNDVFETGSAYLFRARAVLSLKRQPSSPSTILRGTFSPDVLRTARRIKV